METFNTTKLLRKAEYERQPINLLGSKKMENQWQMKKIRVDNFWKTHPVAGDILDE